MFKWTPSGRNSSGRNRSSPSASAAGLATLDVYRDEGLFARSKALEPKWCVAIMGVKGLPNVVDIRFVGLTGAIDLAPVAGNPTLRGHKLLEHAFHDEGVMLRISGDTKNQIDEIMEKVAASIRAVA